ncbi:zinc finger BED domain-containing protein 6-like [Hydra vulgaris]|uniref:zinc finger BED domain-containing protein 6-like n=1 Tax=Hydra vulgaris TaxID=6087 RepID=UPI0032EA6F93
MHFPESHTGKNISEYLHKGLVSFEIPHSKIHIVLQNNAANMVAGVRDSGFRSMPCFIHTIQLCIHDSILSQKSVKDILACCRRLATHSHHSPTAAAKLEAIQEQLGTNKHSLIQDITTRWNSSYDMIERMLDQKVPLATYTADYPTQSTLNSFQWDLLDKVLHILEPFKTLTINFSKRESYLSDVIPSIMALKEFFNQALDNKDKIKNWINEQMQEMQQSNLELESSDSDFDEPSVHNTNEKVSKLITIDECDSNFVNTENSKRLKRLNSNIQMISKEIEEYLKLPLVKEKESLLLWWKNCGNSFKNLKKIT